MARRTVPYEIIDHGPVHSQYFQGCGVSLTPYLYCVTGIGENAKEAYEDALDQAYQIDTVLASRLPTRPAGIRKSDKLIADEMGEDSEIHWHVSIRFGSDASDIA